MRHRDFPSLFTRLRALPAPRRRALVGALAAVCMVAAFGLGWLTGHRAALSGGASAQALALAKRSDDLQDQLAILQRDHQVSQIADRLLQKTLTDRDEEIRSLRADQAFYSKLVGADQKPGGLAVHGVALMPIAHTHAFNFVVTLTHSAEGGQGIDGKLSVAVDGIRADKLTTLEGAPLVGAAAIDGAPFAFKYFQQVRGTLMLPVDFTPNKLRITLDPHDGSPVTRTLAWSDALQNAGDNADSP
ncbi:MAG: DUF6776 family protein [Rhodanobacteraceae bacterium]|nr:hypothetical protein [Pseudomonadota bacterium]